MNLVTPIAAAPRARIAQIDSQIDAVMAEIEGKEKFDVMDAHAWQDAWDRNPDLHATFRDLYRQRGAAQDERDRFEGRVARRRVNRVTLSGMIARTA